MPEKVFRAREKCDDIAWQYAGSECFGCRSHVAGAGRAVWCCKPSCFTTTYCVQRLQYGVVRRLRWRCTWLHCFDGDIGQPQKQPAHGMERRWCCIVLAKQSARRTSIGRLLRVSDALKIVVVMSNAALQATVHPPLHQPHSLQTPRHYKKAKIVAP